jgi:hypothetical protein
MNKSLIAVLFGLLPLASCADKMTDKHSSMDGGGQGVTYTKEVTPANTDGKGQPIAGGKVTTTPDSIWNQSSPAGQRPF